MKNHMTYNKVFTIINREEYILKSVLTRRIYEPHRNQSLLFEKLNINYLMLKSKKKNQKILRKIKSSGLTIFERFTQNINPKYFI